jgi:hypothetical protein
MLRKLAVCASLALALTLAGCNSTTPSAAEESSVGFDASAKTCAKSTECTAEQAAKCTKEEAAACAAKADACCDKSAPKN